MLKSLGTILETRSTQFEIILATIQDTKSVLKTKIDTVALDVGLLRSDHKKLAVCVAEVEAATTTLQPKAKEMQQDIKTLTAGMEALQRWAEDAEGCSRRNNVRFLGTSHWTYS